jgi:hypothetical protein
MPRILVLHEYYGCDTGCCGHVVEIDGEARPFHFAHPESDDGHELRLFAEELVRDEGCDPKDIDWDNCLVLDD